MEEPSGSAPGPIPTELKLKKSARRLSVAFSDGQSFDFSAEYLRVHSPSAEVQGHGPDKAVLVVGKERVNIDRIEPVGRYAVRLVFDDGHDTGLYTWPILYRLGAGYESNWREYLKRLEEAGHRRSADADGEQ